ncbi:MAG: cytochrome-c oxidase, cbb3-type subunit III [Hyphomonadaceae bacterium]
MSVDERDPHSGYKTTGHEWNGIKELNTPVPRPVYFFLIVTFLFSVVYWVLMPAWPTGLSYTKGLLGLDQRASVARDLASANAARAPWVRALETTPVDQALQDHALMARVRDTAPVLFADNCAACHGQKGTGAVGYPNLRDATWLWGGSPDAIEATLRAGVNSGHPDARVSQMPAFGRDQMLPQEDIRAVVAYVRSLSATGTARPAPPARGAEVFAANCASCHGARGEGNQALGAPNLADQDWIYGADAIQESVWDGRQGQMPAWDERLSVAERRLILLYLLDRERSGP